MMKTERRSAERIYERQLPGGGLIAIEVTPVKMTDELLPRLVRPEVKQMTEKMKAHEQKEITAFERKARS